MGSRLGVPLFEPSRVFLNYFIAAFSLHNLDSSDLQPNCAMYFLVPLLGMEKGATFA